MLPIEFKKVLRSSPFFILLLLGLLGVWNLSAVQYAREIFKLRAAERWVAVPKGLPLVQVICPKKAYESETVHLTVWTTVPTGARPIILTVETSEKIEVQGSRQREVAYKEDWFLVPREQGEYVVVVRGSVTAAGLPSEQPLSVYKIDHIPRRWYVILVGLGSVLTAIATLKTLSGWFKREKPPQNIVQKTPV